MRRQVSEEELNEWMRLKPHTSREKLLYALERDLAMDVVAITPEDIEAMDKELDEAED